MLSTPTRMEKKMSRKLDALFVLGIAILLNQVSNGTTEAVNNICKAMAIVAFIFATYLNNRTDRD